MWRCLLIFQLLFLKEVAGPPIQISVGDSRKYVEDLLDKDQDPDEILQINNHIWKKRPGFMLEGDILKEVSRHALSAVFKKWPKTGKCVYVPYVLSTQYNEDQRKILYEAFENFARVTCIRFKKQEDETDFLFIAPVSGCYSYIGRSGGSQLVSLDSTCIRLGPGVAQHELMHALGFYHEQTRPDRDSYVKVLFDNIDAVFADNFQIREGNMQGIPYDYASIMHYSSKAFTKNGEPTMVPFPNSNIAIGQRKAFSDNDILRINLFYNCDISQLGAACESYSFDNPSQELDSLDETILLPPFSKAAVRALRNVNVDGNHSIFSLLSNMEFSDILSPAFHGRGSRSLSLNAGEADLTTSRKTSMYWTTEAKSSKGILPTSTGDPADVSTIISKSSNILALLNGSGTEEPTVSPDVSNLIASVSNSPVDILSPPPRGSRSISNSTEEPDISNLIASLSNSSANILASLTGLGTEEPTVNPELGNLIATVSNSPVDILSPPPRGSRSISNSTEEPDISNLIASLSNSSDNILASLTGLGTEEPTVNPELGNLIASVSNSPVDISSPPPRGSRSISNSTEEPDISNLIASLSNSSDNILALLNGLGTEEPTVSPELSNLIATVSNSPVDILSPPPRGSRSISNSTEEPDISNLIASLSNSSDNILASLTGLGTEEPTVNPELGNLIASVSNSPGDILSPPPRGSRSISNSTEEPDIGNLIASLSNSSDNILASLTGLGTEEPTVNPELGNLIASVSNSPGDILSPPPRGSRSISNSTEEPDIGNLIASLSNSSDNILALLNGLGIEEPTVNPELGNLIASVSNSPGDILSPPPRGSRSISNSTEEPDISNLIASLSNSSDNILALLNGLGTEEPTVSPELGNLIATVSNSPGDILSPPPRGSRSISNSTEEPDISNLIASLSNSSDNILASLTGLGTEEPTVSPDVSNLKASLSNSSDNILALLNGLGTEEPTVSPELGNLIATVSNSPGDILSPPPRGSRSISNSTEEPNISNLIASLSNSSDNILALLNGLGTEWPTDVSAVSPGVSSMAAASNSSVNILASLDGLGLLSPLSTEGLSEAQLLHSCNFELNLCGWKHWPNGDFEWTLSRERPEEFEKNSLPNGETSCRNFAGQYLYLRPPFLLERVQTAVLVSPVFQGSKCFSFWYSVFGQGVKILAIHLQYLHSPDSWHKLWSVERAMTRTWYFEKLDILMDADIKFQIILEGTLSNVNGDAAIDDIVVSGYGCEEFSVHPSPSAVSGLLSTSYPALPLSNDSDTLFCDFENNLCGWQLCSQGDLNWVLHHERSLDTATLLNTSLSGCSMFQGQYLYAEVTSSHLGNRALLASPHFQGSRCMSFWYSMFGNDFGSLNVYVQYAKSPDTWNKVWSSKGSNSRKWYLAELDLFIQPHEVFQIILEWTTERCCGNVAVDDLFVTSHHCNVKTTHEP
uniref:Metalloendopeptidase n=1 Tax=Erpetoichthys calabaricus TaxID=27687 RepID=A0A8C4RC23_ERPCA